MNVLPRKPILILVLAFATTISFSQTNVSAQIEKALSDKDYKRAGYLLESRLDYFFTSRMLDSLPAYVIYVGTIAEKEAGRETAVKTVSLFIEKVKSFSSEARLLSRIYTGAGAFYGALSLNKLAYQTTRQAYSYALKIHGVQQQTLGSINSDMGTFAFRMGDVSLSQYHHRLAIQLLTASKKPDYQSLYVAANNMGSQMWLASKMDSALYYFDIALGALSKGDHAPVNQYYRPAVLQNNMSALYNMQGETTRAITALKSCIENLKVYLSIPETIAKRPNTISFQFEATDNLAGIYKELGDYSQAQQLLQYSYEQKQAHGEEDPTGIFKSQILLGQLYLAMKEHDKALALLNMGLDNISRADGDFLFWQADACGSLALLYDEQGKKESAAHYFEKADSLYEASLQGEYDDIYLEFLRNASLFYAENTQLPTALKKANKGFDYVVKTQGSRTLLAFYQLLNLAEVYLHAGEYALALQYGKKGLAVVEGIARTSKNRMDSVKTELKKPKAILLKVKAEYYLIRHKDVSSLSALLTELNKALGIIERRKTLIYDAKDITLLMADHTDILDFIKRLTLDLFYLTKDKRYIDQLISLHESGLYNRIRSRLDKSDSLQFANVPPSIYAKEKQLKAAITSALEKGDLHGGRIDDYFTATGNWNAFQEMVKQKYPQYYKMRYESIFRSFGDIQHHIPLNTAVIRYFFIDKDLFAIVADRQQKTFISLQTTDLDGNVAALTRYTTDAAQTCEILFSLYRQLWAPLKDHIRYKKVVIIPDGTLFNLNFEVMTPQKLKSFEQLATQSLLSKHTISYQYSLALAGQTARPAALNDNFVAFAPGFSDEDKKRYRSAVKDSFQVDRAYLSLLPQPFTVDFVSKAKGLFGGEAYINNESTSSSFQSNAGKHKIIHIGTHAESNNLYPEFSRLIFAKSDSVSEPNAVFLHEIYNFDLRSELAVLTACETGKPGYKDGEGMISLAHAFNYAGSESMLTALWQIDERASTLLTDAFYKNLLAGLDKDEALTQAKLHYLRTAKGRMLAPQYWAGLVLMGDTSAITFKKARPSTTWWWMAGAILLLGVIAGVFYRFRVR